MAEAVTADELAGVSPEQLPGVTGHVVVVADIASDWLARHLRPGQLSEAFTPPFLGAIAAQVGRRVNAIDLVAVAPALPGQPPLRLRPVTDLDHPRVRRARRYRVDLSVWTTTGGVLALGRGLGGRWEVAVEVDEQCRGRGLGREEQRVPADALVAVHRGVVVVPGHRHLDRAPPAAIEPRLGPAVLVADRERIGLETASPRRGSASAAAPPRRTRPLRRRPARTRPRARVRAGLRSIVTHL